MPIAYAAIAVCGGDGGMVSAFESPSTPPEIPAKALKLVQKLPRHDTRDRYAGPAETTFFFTIENQIIYLCVADSGMAMRITFAMLEDAKEAFCKKYAPPGRKYPDTASLRSCKDFNTTLSSIVRNFNENPDTDKLNKVREKIKEVQNQMVENIEKVLDKGEKITNLVHKTDHLQTSAVSFGRQARALKHEMWKKRAKMILVAICVTLILGGILFLVICKGLKCTQSDDEN